MLARTWSGTEATAVWAELVSSRKKDIEKNQDATQIQGLAAKVAAEQDISRCELARWDASARAWLLCADEVQKVKLTQLRLTTRDCGLHVSSIGDTYTSVIQVWTAAMKTMQDLIVGMPQRISKGAVLVGISAWHIYPDLNVVGPLAHIHFDDELVKDGGVITIGLQNASPDEEKGVQWSLSLSHLRYYGHPVKVSTTAADASLRVTMRELHWAALGSLFATWAPCVTDNTTACEFLLALRDIVSGSQVSNFAWLRLVWDASQQFVDLSSTERENALSLMAYGRRKGRKFFNLSAGSTLPLFDFASPMLVDSLSWATPTHDTTVFEYALSCINYMRDLVLRKGSAADQYVIRYCGYYGQVTFRGRPIRGPKFRRPMPEWYHYTTARTTESVSAKRDRYGNPKVDKIHHHWLSHLCPESSIDPRQWPTNENTMYLYHAKDILCYNYGFDFHFLWRYPPKSLCGNKLDEDEKIACFEFIAGYPEEVALYKLKNERKTPTQDFLKDTEVTSLLRYGHLKPNRIVGYLALCQDALNFNVEFPAAPNWAPRDDDNRAYSGRSDNSPGSRTVIRTLTNLAKATRLYDQLPGATVSITVLGCPLVKPHWSPADTLSDEHNWIKETFSINPRQMASMERGRKFACIAMFESGNLDLTPESIGSVMAMSSGNSIFTLTSFIRDVSRPRSENIQITRILGNLNRPGIVMLVAPQAPVIRKSDPGAWRVVTHAPFDGESLDDFANTFLHLSFTDYEMPLIVRTGVVDAEVTILESLVSVYDRQNWTADIEVVGNMATGFQVDILDCLGCELNSNESILLPKEFARRLEAACRKRLISIDSWEELLDPPEHLGEATLGVLRAVGNWQARLAAATVSRQLGYETSIRPKDMCEECLITCISKASNLSRHAIQILIL